MGNFNVIIISGHGGNPYDPGAVGCGLTEAVETRRLANALKPRLEAYGVNVIMYDQNKNAYQEIINGRYMNLSNVSYVIEIHFNAGVADTGGNGVTTGTEILVHGSEGGTSVEEITLKKICALGFKNRGVKRRTDLAVMNYVFRNGISHALIETCFIDDADDVALYKKQFNNIAKAIADGVAEGFGLTDNNVGNMEEKDMTKEDVLKIIADEEAKKTYNKVEELPFGADTVQKLIDKGIIKGVDDKGNLGMSYDSLRIIVILDRAGVFGE